MSVAHVTAQEIATRIIRGDVSAVAVAEAALADIARRNGILNAFTALTEVRARRRAAEIDARIAAGKPVGPLAGVPFAVKNLFDIAGLTTLAGSKINRERPPAGADATLVQRVEAAGGVLVGALNMGEYAYDFTGENAHDGPSRNPRDVTRMTGGSSGGSGGAVASGLVPLALGSDTNGSIRVPASFCGVFGLKPTYGRLSRVGTYPFASSFDHLGPMARSVTDLALSYDAMQGADAADPMQAVRPVELTAATLDSGTRGVRIAILGGYFETGAHAEAIEAVRLVSAALAVTRKVEIAEAARARAAAFVITAAESAALHLDRIRSRPADYDPAVRDRLIAGAMIPASAVARAQKFRRWYRNAVLELFESVDILLAPATPCPAPKLGQTTLDLNGRLVPLRPNIGIFTQPISFIGLPVVAVPVPLTPLPMAVQVIAAPWREDLALRVARALEASGVAAAPIARETQ